MATKGTVTKTSCPKPYLARFADGTSPGMFQGMREAQEAIEAGAGRLGSLYWTVDANLAAQGIEAYNGTDTAP